MTQRSLPLRKIPAGPASAPGRTGLDGRGRTPTPDDAGRSRLRTDTDLSGRRLDGSRRAWLGPSAPAVAEAAAVHGPVQEPVPPAVHCRTSKFVPTGGDSGIFVLSLHSVSTQTRG